MMGSFERGCEVKEVEKEKIVQNGERSVMVTVLQNISIYFRAIARKLILLKSEGY
jgi:hypothetical protein